VALYLIGDGREGIPMMDGTLSALKAGLQVEVFRDRKDTLKEHVSKDVKELKESGAFEPLQDPLVQDLTLADGTKAIVLDAEFVRVQNRRVSFQTKVYAADANGAHVVASGFITCSRPGRSSVKAIALPDFVRAHATSLVLDPAKVDAASTKGAYEKYNWNASAALARASKANDLLEKEQYGQAAAGFRDALELSEQLPAAHNGLAWSLLYGERPQADDIKEALREAREAVKQTEELDVSALDTLALAHYRSGDKEQAIKTIKQALKLQPNHPELQERLRSFE
jgi:tetratricopeptide (TPR) repeat protein